MNEGVIQLLDAQGPGHPLLLGTVSVTLLTKGGWQKPVLDG